MKFKPYKKYSDPSDQLKTVMYNGIEIFIPKSHKYVLILKDKTLASCKAKPVLMNNMYKKETEFTSLGKVTSSPYLDVKSSIVKVA